MSRLASVLFDMGTLDSNPLATGKFQPTITINWRIVLRDLVVFGHIRIEIVLAMES
jgi:hypothetical protein